MRLCVKITECFLAALQGPPCSLSVSSVHSNRQILYVQDVRAPGAHSGSQGCEHEKLGNPVTVLMQYCEEKKGKDGEEPQLSATELCHIARCKILIRIIIIIIIIIICSLGGLMAKIQPECPLCALLYTTLQSKSSQIGCTHKDQQKILVVCVQNLNKLALNDFFNNVDRPFLETNNQLSKHFFHVHNKHDFQLVLCFLILTP